MKLATGSLFCRRVAEPGQGPFQRSNRPGDGDLWMLRHVEPSLYAIARNGVAPSARGVNVRKSSPAIQLRIRRAA